MLHSKNIRNVLRNTLSAVDSLTTTTGNLQSAILLSAVNGSIISYVNGEERLPNYNSSVNNLRMMALLIKDKWSEDEEESSMDEDIRYVYNFEGETTRIYTYELEDLHTCVAQIPRSDLLLLLIGGSQYPHGLLVLKMKYTLQAFSQMHGYKLE